jgi:hypothetical protein
MNLQEGLWHNLLKNPSSNILSSGNYFSFYLSNKIYFDVSLSILRTLTLMSYHKTLGALLEDFGTNQFIPIEPLQRL